MASLASFRTLLRGESGKKTRGVLKVIILCLIAVAAIASRLFSVISKDSLAHAPWSGRVSC